MAGSLDGSGSPVCLPDAVKCFRPPSSSLLDLDKRAAKVLRMQEQHRLAVCACPRLAVSEHPGAGRFEMIAGGENIIDFVAEMMDPAIWIAFKEVRNRRALAEGLEQLDLGIG